jgi:site-specific DNA-cytosine methylase
MEKKNIKDVTFGSVMPLLGGMTVGCMKALEGKKPEWVISYPGFYGNDKHIMNYLGEGEVPYLKLDPADNNPLKEPTGEFDENDEEILEAAWDLDNLDQVDFVNAVPPCAGLSLLNASNNKESSTSRGSHATQNDWMYITSRFVLDKVKPKVFWGENAPGLYTSNGQGVRDNLREIAKEYGYSFSVMKTDTFLHGVPQKRARTFFFFWDSPTAPILNYYKREKKNLKEYLAEIPESANLQDKYFQGDAGADMMNNRYIEWLVNVDKSSPQEVAELGFKTFYGYIVTTQTDEKDPSKRKIDDIIEWFEQCTTEEDVKNKTKDGKCLRALRHVKNKFLMGKGWWDSSPHFWNDHINAVIGRTMEQSVHPTLPRMMNIREYMHLMGLPHDFDVVGTSWNHIAQNVPVNTVSDWATEVLKYINGELEDSGADYVKQNNVRQCVDHRNVFAKELFEKPASIDVRDKETDHQTTEIEKEVIEDIKSKTLF